MIELLTLFLSLTAGTRPVTVAVSEEVAAVELRLDGAPVGEVRGEPWTLEVDFGAGLLPHQLVAVARDAEGDQLARARQLINLPRPRAEARLALHGEPSGERWAQLTWESVEGLTPVEIAVSFDGEPLPVTDPERILLPPHDPEQLHLLSAELTFPGELEARTALGFGGIHLEAVDAELTAVPVIAPAAGVEPPAAAEMTGWFRKDGEPLRVFTVERTPAEVLLVLDDRARADVPSIFSGPSWGSGSREVLRRRVLELPDGVRPGDRLRVAEIRPDPRRLDAGKVLFPVTADLRDHEWVGIPEVLLDRAARDPKRTHRLADAVAVAALTAAESERIRAVVLVVGEQDGDDRSQFSAGAVRDYLRALRVPLRVWSTRRRAAEGNPWGEVVEVGRSKALSRAVEELRRDLDRQLMVWLVGSHLPQEVELTEPGWRLAGE